MNIETATKIITLSTATLLFFGTQLSDDALLFFLVGAIPGTDHNIPSGVMLALFSFAACAVGCLVAHTYGLDRRLVSAANAAKQAFTHRDLSDAA